MNLDELRDIFDRQLRRELRASDPGTVIERVDSVVRQVGGVDDWNGIVWSGLNEQTADAAIAEQVQYFDSINRECEWKVYAHDQPADLEERLLAAGFVPGPEEAVMIAEISTLPTAVNLPDGVHLRPVTDAAGVDLVAQVHEEAFGTSSERLRNRLLDQMANSPQTIMMMVVMAGDTPVSVARMDLCPGTDFAGLWGGGTVPAWRGRGIYRALIAHRAGIAGNLGYRFLQVDASDQSRPILARLGFRQIGTTTPYLR